MCSSCRCCHSLTLFLLSLNRNLDWLYSTPAGRQQIIVNAQYTTMAFIYLQSDQVYRNLEQVKLEMSNAVLDFKPVNLNNNIQVNRNRMFTIEYSILVHSPFDLDSIFIVRRWHR
jgi:hypothetical protein